MEYDREMTPEERKAYNKGRLRLAKEEKRMKAEVEETFRRDFPELASRSSLHDQKKSDRGHT